MNRTGMLRKLRRDCWGCDNNVLGQRHACTCSTTKTDRTNEKREWLREAREEVDRDA